MPCWASIYSEKAKVAKVKYVCLWCLFRLQTWNLHDVIVSCCIIFFMNHRFLNHPPPPPPMYISHMWVQTICISRLWIISLEEEETKEEEKKKEGFLWRRPGTDFVFLLFFFFNGSFLFFFLFTCSILSLIILFLLNFSFKLLVVQEFYIPELRRSIKTRSSVFS